MPEEHGLGCLPSPPDPRDLPIELAYQELRVAPLAVPPPQFFRANSPLLDQEQTPQCVAYSCASLKADQDRVDMGKWFNFDEARFFYSIGGGPMGAYLRNGMGRMRAYGYPEQGGSNADKHRIKAYYAVPIEPLAIKQALVAFGPLVLGTNWASNWMTCPDDGQLPSPQGSKGGHAIKCYGYSPAGLYLRNSWGSWGARMPSGRRTGNGIMAWHDLGRVFECWKSADMIQR